MFHATKLFGQNGRLFLTEPCRSPIPTSLAPYDSRCPLSRIEAGRREIALRRGRHNRLGFAYQVAFVCVRGRFDTTKLKMDTP